MAADIATRFAPSPTGRLHLGHAWSALRAHDRARQAGGRFLLRIEDIDGGRSRSEFIDGVFQDLRWLGLGWDGDVLLQSSRTESYADALDRLAMLGLAYVCTCTRAEIAASAPQGPQGPQGPVYPGTCRALGRASDPGGPYCWRLDMAKAVALTGPLHWFDERAGPVNANPLAQGDIVIARKDAAASYHLAVTIDDAFQQISHIVRGRDLFEATHVHRLLQELLGLPVPIYNHHALIVGADGERLAKRRNSPTIESLRIAGYDPKSLVADMRTRRFPIGFGLDTP